MTTKLVFLPDLPCARICFEWQNGSFAHLLDAYLPTLRQLRREGYMRRDSGNFNHRGRICQKSPPKTLWGKQWPSFRVKISFILSPFHLRFLLRNNTYLKGKIRFRFMKTIFMELKLMTNFHNLG